MVVRIVLDTNFLMVPGQFGVDVFTEIEQRYHNIYKLCVCSGTIKELEKLLATKKQKDRIAAKIALELVSKKGLEIIDTEDQYVDDVLVRLSSNKDYLIATQDVALKKRLKKYIHLRQKKFIEIRGSES